MKLSLSTMFYISMEGYKVKRTMKEAITLFMSMSIILSSIPITAFASEPNPIISEEYAQSIQNLESFVEKDIDGYLYLNIDAESAGVDCDYYDKIVADMDYVNSMIASGYLVADEEGQLAITDTYISKVRENVINIRSSVIADGDTLIVKEKPSIVAFAYSGVNKVVWRWYGVDLYLNSANANRVASGLGIGAALGALFPDPVVSKAIGVALGVNSGIIAYNNAKGRGVIISLQNITEIPFIFWIASQ
jgi:hypothetical protein